MKRGKREYFRRFVSSDVGGTCGGTVRHGRRSAWLGDITGKLGRCRFPCPCCFRFRVGVCAQAGVYSVLIQERPGAHQTHHSSECSRMCSRDSRFEPSLSSISRGSRLVMRFLLLVLFTRSRFERFVILIMSSRLRFYRTPALRGGPFSWTTGRCVIPEKKIIL